MLTSVRDALLNTSFGTTLTVAGWVRSVRKAKTFSFIALNDGSIFDSIQIVVDESLPDYEENVATLGTGSAVEVEGTFVESQGSGQRGEIQAATVRVPGPAGPDYPLQKKHHSFEFLRTIAHLRPRTNTFGAIARLRSSLSYAIHTFFQQRGFCCVHTPIITLSDCEGAGEMFRVTAIDPADPPRTEAGAVDFTKDFFGAPAYLSVSGQLEAELYASALTKVYTFGPTFRAENSNTARHLAEFWMVEPEMAFCDLQGDMDMAESFVRSVVGEVLAHNGDDLAFFNKRIDTGLLERLHAIAESDFARVTYTEAVDRCAKNNTNFEFPIAWGQDLQSEHERFLSEKEFKRPVIVHDFPRAIKPFYMKLNDDEKTVAAMDVLVPGIGELVGGSEREARLDVLRGRIRETGLSEDDYHWYCDLRRYGSVPHAGFGLGFERMMLALSGMANIRDVIPFPRTPGSALF